MNRTFSEYWADFIGVTPSDPLALSLADASTAMELKPDDRLLLDRDPAGPVFLLTDGVLKVVKQSQNGHEIWLADFGAPAIVGELSAILGAPRTSDVVAETKVTVLSVPYAAFSEALTSHVKLANALNVELAKRVKATSEKLAELYSVSVMGRLHFELVRLGTPDENDDEVYLIASVINVSEMAARIHATRESTSRALSRLKQMGIVRTENGGMKVIAPRLE
ncbi:MAG: Crp/Fnr family transcriptional regulator [Henriciella sp.]|nr:Crp/Fnr family transcriptional regulator [Henriciella sp.]